MTNPSANLRVRVSADLADIKQGLGLLRGELAKVKTQAAQSAPNMDGWSRGIQKVRADLSNLVGAYVGIQTITGGIRALFSAFDRADRIGEVARIAGISTEALSRLAFGAQFSGVQLDQLQVGITKFNRELVSNADLVSKLGVSVYEAGTKNFRPTEQIILDLADVFASLPDGPERAALAIKLFGRSGGDLIPVLIEGRKRLEEFGDQADATGNTISESAAKAAGELNDNLDVLKGTLTGVANETAKNLIPAIAGYSAAAASSAQTSSLAAEAGQTLGGALRVVTAAAIVVKNVVEAATVALGFLGNTAFRISQTIIGNFGKAIGTIAGAYSALLDGENPLKVLSAYQTQIKQVVADGSEAIGGLPKVVANNFKVMKDEISAAGSDITAAFALFDSAAVSAGASAKAAGDEAAEAAKPSQQLMDTLRKLLGGEAAGTGDRTKQMAASLALLRDSISRAQKELDRLYEANEIGITDYYATRQQLQERAIDADIAQAQAELAVTKEVGQRRKIEEDIIKLQRDRAEIAVVGAREQKKAEEDLAKALGDVKVSLMELDGDTAAAERVRLEEQYLELFKRLEKASDETGKAMVANLIDRLVDKAKLDQLRDAASKITSSLQNTETSISSQSGAGMLGQVEAERQLDEQRGIALAKLVALRQEASAFMATMAVDSPEAEKVREFLAELDGNIATVGSSMQQFRQKIADAAIDSVTNLFMDLVDGSKSAGEALRDFVRGFALAMAQIAARALATYLVLQLLDAIYPGLGKATAATMSAGVHHAGGIAGAGGRMRHGLSESVFLGAPRYHTGGIAGTAPDEVPAILQRGEEVLTKNDPRHRRNGGLGGDGAMVKQPIVAIGDRAVADAIAGSAGEQAVITHVRNNWDALTRGNN